MPIPLIDRKTGDVFDAADPAEAQAQIKAYGLEPASPDDVAQFEAAQKYGSTENAVRTLPGAALASTANAFAGATEIAGQAIQGVTGYGTAPGLVARETPPTTGATLAPSAFTPEQKAMRLANPKAAFLGAVAPDIAAGFAVPGEGLAGLAGRAVTAGITGEGAASTLEDRPFTVEGAAQGGLVAGVLEGAGHVALGAAMRALGKTGPSALDRSVQNVQRAAVADLATESNPVVKLQKLQANAGPALEQYQTQLDQALSTIDERLAAAPDKMFTPAMLRRTVSEDAAAQGSEIAGLAHQLGKSAEVTGNIALRQAGDVLAQAADGTGPEMFLALREAHSILNEPEAVNAVLGKPARSALYTEAGEALDASLKNQSLWGRAAQHHAELSDLPLMESPQFRIDDVAAREELDARLQLARQVGTLTGDKRLGTAAKQAADALGSADAVIGARLLGPQAPPKPPSLGQKIGQAVVDFGEQRIDDFAKTGLETIGASIGTGIGGVPGGALGYMAGRRAHGMLGKQWARKIWSWAKTTAKQNPTKIAGAGLLAASGLDKNKDDSMLAANVGLLAFFLPAGGRAAAAERLGEALSGITARERMAVRVATERSAAETGQMLRDYATGKREFEHEAFGTHTVVQPQDLLDAQHTIQMRAYARHAGMGEWAPGHDPIDDIPPEVADALLADLNARNAALVDNDEELKRLAQPGRLDVLQGGGERPATIVVQPNGQPMRIGPEALARAESALRDGDMPSRAHDSLAVYAGDLSNEILSHTSPEDAHTIAYWALGRWKEDFPRVTGRQPNAREYAYAEHKLLALADERASRGAEQAVQGRRAELRAVQGGEQAPTEPAAPQIPARMAGDLANYREALAEMMRRGVRGPELQQRAEQYLSNWAGELQLRLDRGLTREELQLAEREILAPVQGFPRFGVVEGGGEGGGTSSAPLRALQGGQTDLDRLGLPGPAETSITERNRSRGAPGFVPEGFAGERPVTVPPLDVQGPPIRNIGSGGDQVEMGRAVEAARQHMQFQSDGLAQSEDMPAIAYNYINDHAHALTERLSATSTPAQIYQHVDAALGDWVAQYHRTFGRMPTSEQSGYARASIAYDALAETEALQRTAVAVRRARREAEQAAAPDPQIAERMAARERRRQVDAEANRLRAERTAAEQHAGPGGPLRLSEPEFSEENPALVHGIETGMAQRLDDALGDDLQALVTALDHTAGSDHKEAPQLALRWPEIRDRARQFAAENPSITGDEAERFAKARFDQTISASKEDFDPVIDEAASQLARDGRSYDSVTENTILHAINRERPLSRPEEAAVRARIAARFDDDIESVMERATLDTDSLIGRAQQAAHYIGRQGDELDMDRVFEEMRHDGEGNGQRLSEAEKDFLEEHYRNTQDFEDAHAEGEQARRDEFDSSEVESASEEAARTLGENGDRLNWTSLRNQTEEHLGRDLDDQERDWLHDRYHESSHYEGIHEEAAPPDSESDGSPDSEDYDGSQSGGDSNDQLPPADELRAAGLDRVEGAHRSGVERVFGGEPLTMQDTKQLFALEELRQYAADTGSRIRTTLHVSNHEVLFSAEGEGLDIKTTYEKKPEGLSVYQDRLFLPETQQGLGLARKFIRSVFQGLERRGATEIRCSAAEIGKYVWPSLGFRPEPYAEQECKRQFLNFLRDAFPAEELDKLGGLEAIGKKIETIRDVADASLPLPLAQKHMDDMIRSLVGSQRDLPENILFHVVKGAEFKAGKAFLLARSGSWNNGLRLSIDRSDAWYREFLKRVGLPSIAGVGVYELVKSFVGQRLDANMGEPDAPRAPLAADAAVIEQQARQQRTALTENKLAYLQSQAKATTQTTARALTGPSLRVVQTTPGLTQSAGVAQFAGEHDNLRAAFDAKRETLKRLQTDPMQLVDTLASSLSDLADASPDLHRKIVAKTYQIVAFLQSKLPSTIGATLMRPEGTPPSDTALKQFSLYYSAATNPSSVHTDLANNRARKEQVDTLREIWPEVYQSLKMSVLQSLADGARPTLAQRTRLDLLFDFGPSLDGALSDRIVSARMAYLATVDQTNAPKSAPSRKTQPSIQGSNPLGKLSTGTAAA